RIVPREVRLEFPDTISPQVVALIRILAIIRDVKFGSAAQALIISCVALVSSQVKDVPMAGIPIKVVIPQFQGVGLKALCFLIEGTLCVRTSEKAIRSCAVKAMILCHMPRFSLSMAEFAGTALANVFYSSQCFSITKDVKSRHGVIVHVPPPII